MGRLVRPRRERSGVRVEAAPARLRAGPLRRDRGSIRARRTRARHRRAAARGVPKVKHARLILLALALCAVSAWAGPGPDPEPAGMATGDQQAQLDLFINGDEKDTALVVLPRGAYLVAPDDL